MMKRLLTSILFCFVPFFIVYSKPITPEVAQRLAQLCFSSSSSSSLRSSSPIVLTYTRTAKDVSLFRTTSLADAPFFYVFNRGANDGFVLISGDDRLVPVLASSDNGHFDINNMPENLAYWIRRYDLQIASVLEIDPSLGNYESFNTKILGNDVEPLLEKEKILWDQGDPFNRETPSYTVQNGVKRSYTGCVATAVSQVMRYWKWPKRAKPSIVRYVDNYKNITRERKIGETDYDWSKMPGTINNPKNVPADVATQLSRLLADVGYASQMMYNVDGYGSSGAYTQDAAIALRKYFFYKNTTTIRNRHNYNGNEWRELLYNELKEGRPVCYSGAFEPVGAGHAFVCDGYRKSDGSFHFNWGWSGAANGYYQLEALSPSSLGAGAGMGLFSGQEEIIVGMEPAINGDAGILPHAGLDYILRLSSGENKIDFSFVNITDLVFNGSVRIGFFKGQKIEGTPVLLLEEKRNLVVETFGDYTNVITLSNINLPDGTYSIGGQVKPNSSNQWMSTRISSDEPNYAVVTIKNKMITSVQYDASVSNLEINTTTVQGKLVPYNKSTISFEVTNNSSREYYGIMGIIVAPKGTPVDYKKAHTYNITQQRIEANSTIRFTTSLRKLQFPSGTELDIYAVYCPVSENFNKVGYAGSTMRRLLRLKLLSAKSGETIADGNNPSKTMLSFIIDKSEPTTGFAKLDVSEKKSMGNAKFSVSLAQNSQLVDPQTLFIVPTIYYMSSLSGDKKVIFSNHSYDASKMKLNMTYNLGVAFDGEQLRPALGAYSAELKMTICRKQNNQWVEAKDVTVEGNNSIIVQIYDSTFSDIISEKTDYCYPTVTRNCINIVYKDAISILLYDVKGQLVSSYQPTPTGLLSVNVEALPDGEYMISIKKHNGEKSTLRFVIEK